MLKEAFQQRVAPYPPALEMLTKIGFRDDEEGHLVLKHKNRAPVIAADQVLKRARKGLGCSTQHFHVCVVSHAEDTMMMSIYTHAAITPKYNLHNQSPPPHPDHLPLPGQAQEGRGRLGPHLPPPDDAPPEPHGYGQRRSGPQAQAHGGGDCYQGG